MARKSKLSLKMQVAAVKAAREEGKSLDDIEKAHPELKDGVASVRGEYVAPPTPRRSGSGKAYSSMSQRPTL